MMLTKNEINKKIPMNTHRDFPNYQVVMKITYRL